MRVSKILTLLAAVAVVAFGCTGAALAAGKKKHHYLITSTSQVAPSVLKKFEGNAITVGIQGPKGDTGATGLTGATGAPGPQGPAGPQGAVGPQGPQGPQGVAGVDANGIKGDTGATGAQGAQGPQGVQGEQGPRGFNGSDGAEGPQGPAGTPGSNGAFTYTYASNSGPDSGDCGNAWANDSYSRTFQVNPLPDGSYDVSELITGTFTTIASVDEPNPGTCPGPPQVGGVTGTFYGTESWVVPAPAAGESADFDPVASCSACDAHTTSGSSAEAGNAAFEAAYFPGSTYALDNYDFVYHSNANANESWVDSNTPSGANGGTGNIDG
jgi:hypothetical protein